MAMRTFYVRSWFSGWLLLVMAAACDGPCPYISQTVFVTSPDEQLLGLMEVCSRELALRSCLKDDVTCPCRPLCLRLLELVDGFKGNEELESCYIYPSRQSQGRQNNAGAFSLSDDALVASLTYTPSRCDEQAR